MSCIEMSGIAEGALTNVERIMTVGPSGEAVGLNMSSTDAVDKWMESVDSVRCRCFMQDATVYVPKGSVADY